MITQIVVPMVFILVSVGITALLFYLAHLIFQGRRSIDTSKFIQQMALRIGVLHALVVALVFGVLVSELMEMQNMSDSEAIAAAGIYWTLADTEAPEMAEVRALVPVYLKSVVEIEWPAIHKNPHNLPNWRIIEQMRKKVLHWEPGNPGDKRLQDLVYQKINTVAQFRNWRLIEAVAPNLPVLFWVIAIGGYFLTLTPYLFIELNRQRLFLISCYAAMVGITFYSLVLLSNPGLYKVLAPTAFEVVYSEIQKGSPEEAHPTLKK